MPHKASPIINKITLYSCAAFAASFAAAIRITQRSKCYAEPGKEHSPAESPGYDGFSG